MSQAKLLNFKNSPTNFLFREIFRLEANYINPVKLSEFPRELKLDTSEFNKSLKKISAFAVSKYLIIDLTNLRPKIILRSIISLPKQLFITILKARSKF